MYARLGIVTTHPIQYQTPWFRSLAAHHDLSPKVYFARIPDAEEQGEGFGHAFHWDIPLLDGYEWELLTCLSRPARSSHRLRRLRHYGVTAMGECFRRDRIECVLFTGWHERVLWQGLAAAERARLPRMVRGESNALKARPWWVSMVHRRLLARYQAFLAIGEANHAFYLGNGVDRDAIFSAPYFVDNQRFAQQARELIPARSEHRQRFGLDPTAPVFLYVGKLEPKKRIFDLLTAVDMVNEPMAKSKGVSLEVLVVGSGELEAQARALVRERNLPVHFTGFLNQSEVGAAYAAADCLVLPSDYGETWGLVVNEAMAFARPAIVSDRVGCHPDLVKAGETGWVFPFGDPGKLAQCMVQACALGSDGSGLSAMGEKAARRVHGCYGVAQVVKGTLGAMAYLSDSQK